MKKLLHVAGILTVGIFAFLIYKSFLSTPIVFLKGKPNGDIEIWYGIYFQGHKIGYSVFTRHQSEKGYILADKTFMKVSMLGKDINALSYTEASLDKKGVLEKFYFTLKSSDAEFDINGIREGAELKLLLQTSAGEGEMTIPFDENMFLPLTIGSSLSRLKAEKEIRVPLFDPSTLSRSYVKLTLRGEDEIEVMEEKIKVFVVEQEFQGIKTTSYIRNDGIPLMEESSIGLKTVAEIPKKAVEEGWDEEVDIIDLSAVPLINKTGISLKEAKFATLRIYNWDGEPPPGFVKMKSYYEITLRKIDVGKLESVKSGIAKGMYTEEEPLLEVNAKEIREKAEMIIKGEKNILKKAERIFWWVYNNVKKEPSFTVPSALEVLKNMRGDCNEHAVLYTALVRAVGIPAKIVVGLVQQGNSLYYHAWTEIFYREWIPVDPTLGQFPADLSHVKLGEGSIGRWIEAMRGLGRLKVEVIKAGR